MFKNIFTRKKKDEEKGSDDDHDSPPPRGPSSGPTPHSSTSGRQQSSHTSPHGASHGSSSHNTPPSARKSAESEDMGLFVGMNVGARPSPAARPRPSPGQHQQQHSSTSPPSSTVMHKSEKSESENSPAEGSAFSFMAKGDDGEGEKATIEEESSSPSGFSFIGKDGEEDASQGSNTSEAAHAGSGSGSSSSFSFMAADAEKVAADIGDSAFAPGPSYIANDTDGSSETSASASTMSSTSSGEKKQPARVISRRRKGGKAGTEDNEESVLEDSKQDKTEKTEKAAVAAVATVGVAAATVAAVSKPAAEEKNTTPEKKQPEVAAVTTTPVASTVSTTNTNVQSTSLAHPQPQPHSQSAAAAAAPVAPAVVATAATPSTTASSSSTAVQEKPKEVPVAVPTEAVEDKQEEEEEVAIAPSVSLLSSLASLKDKLNSNLASCAAKEQSLRSAKRRLNNHRRKRYADLTQLRQSISTLHRDLDTAAAAEDYELADSLTQQLEATHSNIASAEEEINGFEAQFSALDQQLQDVLAQRKGHLDTFCSELQSLVQLQEAAVDQATYVPPQDVQRLEDELRDACARLARRERHVRLDLEDVHARKAALKSRIDASTSDLQAQLSTLEKQRASIDDEIAVLEATLAAKKRDAVRLAKLAEEASSRIAQMASKFDREREEVATEESHLTSVLSNIETEKMRISEEERKVEAAVAKARAKEEAEKSLLAQLRAERQQAKSQVSDIQVRGQALLEDSSRESAVRLQEAEADRLLSNLRAAVAALEEELQKAAEKTLRIQNDMSNLRAQLARADIRLPELAAEKKLAVAARNFKEAQRIQGEMGVLQQLQSEGEAKGQAFESELKEEEARVELLRQQRESEAERLAEEEKRHDQTRIRMLTKMLLSLRRDMTAESREEIAICEGERKLLCDKHGIVMWEIEQQVQEEENELLQSPLSASSPVVAEEAEVAAPVEGAAVLSEEHLPTEDADGGSVFAFLSAAADAEDAENVDNVDTVEDSLMTEHTTSPTIADESNVHADDFGAIGTEDVTPEQPLQAVPEEEELSQTVTESPMVEAVSVDADAELRAAVEKERQAIQAKLASAHSELEELQAACTEVDAQIVAASEAEDYDRAAELQAEFDTLMEQVGELQSRIAELNGRIDPVVS